MLVCCYYMLLYLDPSRLDCNLAQPWHRCPGRYNLRIGRPSPRESAEPIRDSGFEAWPTSDPAVMSAANVCGKCLRSIQVYLLIAQQQNSDVIVFRPLDLFDQHVKHLVRTWHCNMVIEISELRRHSKTINALNIFLNRHGLKSSLHFHCRTVACLPYKLSSRLYASSTTSTFPAADLQCHNAEKCREYLNYGELWDPKPSICLQSRAIQNVDFVL